MPTDVVSDIEAPIDREDELLSKDPHVATPHDATRRSNIFRNSNSARVVHLRQQSVQKLKEGEGGKGKRENVVCVTAHTPSESQSDAIKTNERTMNNLNILSRHFLSFD